MQPDAAALLWDVHEAAMKFGRFTAGLDERSYSADDLRKSAVERQLEIVGEAFNKLRLCDPETAQQVPDLARIIGLRNILAHAYAVIDDSVVWSAASQRVPELLTIITRLLAQ
jgi:uncharacterized protein with HEPN domain